VIFNGFGAFDEEFVCLGAEIVVKWRKIMIIEKISKISHQNNKI
jgi:hypothetical protein